MVNMKKIFIILVSLIILGSVAILLIYKNGISKVSNDETLEFHVYKIQGGYNIIGVNYETYLKYRSSIDKTLAKINQNSEKDYRDNIRCPKILKNKEGIFNLMIFPENIMSCLKSNRVIFLTDKLNAINVIFALEAVEESENKLYKLSKAYVNGSSWNLELWKACL